MKIINYPYLFILLLIFLLVNDPCFASNNSVSFSLEAISKNIKSNSWSIVVPNFLIEKKSHLTLLDGDGHEVNAEFYVAATWGQKPETIYIRSVIIKAIKAPKIKSKYKLLWSISEESNLSNQIHQTSMGYDARLSASWLSSTFYAPVLSINNNKVVPWFDEAYQGYGRTIAKQDDKKQGKELNRASIWLYDRTLSLYLLYLKTGDLKWKKSAHYSADFYQKHLDKTGGFTLKPGDMKYSNSQGLLLDYLFYPEQRTLDNIYLMYKKTLIWPVKIKKEGFWTERHHSIALSSVISYWALTGDTNASIRIKQLINEMESFLNVPYNQNCLQHPFESHEGWDLATAVCSPWMSALIIEQLWRYHHLTFDFKSIYILEKLNEFLISRAVFKHVFAHKEVTAIPKYLVYLSPELNEKEEPWMDYQHACDVASAIAKGAYAQHILGKDTKQTVNILNLMIRSCYRSMYRGHGNRSWPIAPVRKFNWWFSSTGSFTWLLRYHNASYTPSYTP